MKPVSRLVRAALALALLGSVAGVTQPHPASAAPRTASGLVRYTNAADGYTLLAPTSWVRLPGVRWTPAGPPADLTLMTPDHQAAFGITVTPTGGRTYADVALQHLALRLLYQENGVIPTMPIQPKAVVVNGVTFQTATALPLSGSTYTYSSETNIAVWVTQHDHRLYAIASVVYLFQAAPPPPPPPGYPTPTPIGGSARTPDARYSNQDLDTAPPAPLPTAGPATTARRLTQDAAGPPPPLSSDHLRGNPCPQAGDGALIYRDKNCSAHQDLQMIATMASSFRFTPGATSDQRPAARVGADGFAGATDPALGVSLAYPAQWTTLTEPNTIAAFRSPDQNALVTLDEEQINSETLGLSDLQAVADTQISQVSSGPAPTYLTMQINGITYLRALAQQAIVRSQSGALLQAQVSVMVASYHHRAYALRAIALTYLSSLADNSHAPYAYPYFSPFTTLARSTQSTADLLRQQSNLAAETTWTLSIDPHVPDA